MATDDNSPNVDLVLETHLMTLDGIASSRKIRLFCCACTRRVWKLLSRAYQRAIEVAEGFSDCQMSDIDLGQLYSSIEVVDMSDYRRKCACRAAAWSIHPNMSAGSIARSVASSVSQAVKAGDKERRAQLDLLRDIFGSLLSSNLGDDFLPLWRTSTVVAIATSAYETRVLPSGQINSHHLHVLADALEDAGCHDRAVLDHCRSDGLHVRGCWVVDLVLGKS